jgi:hypothetical protein
MGVYFQRDFVVVSFHTCWNMTSFFEAIELRRRFYRQILNENRRGGGAVKWGQAEVIYGRIVSMSP